MASRRAGTAALAALARVAAARRGKESSLEPIRRCFASSSTGWPSRAEYTQPGALASVAPWTYHHREQQQQIWPWAVAGNNQPQLVSSEESKDKDKDRDGMEVYQMEVAEARKIVRHVNTVALKKSLKADHRDSISYAELLEICKEYRVGSSEDELMRYARSLDETGVVLIFRENVYLHPERVAKLVAHALPFAVVSPNDPRRAELMGLELQKAEIDTLAHKQVRRFLWTGLGALTFQTALFFRLTFWELSWDVMEPIAFFLTTAGLIAGYTYFLITARDPSYQDFMKRLFLSKQRKLFRKYDFDYEKYRLLRRQCQCVEPEEVKW